jgi:uncharacterized membrane protein YjgN (DUF898 family)
MVPAGPRRVQFEGKPSEVLVAFLLYYLAPIVAGAVIVFVFTGVGAGMAAVSRPHVHGHGHHSHASPIAAIFVVIGVVLMLAVIAFGFLMLFNKLFAFRMDNLVVDGQRCKYTGSVGGLAGVHLLNMILVLLTAGFYTPWAIVRYLGFMYASTEVNGQRGRLTFDGNARAFFVKWLIGHVVTNATCGIYGAWYMNDLFAFVWEGTRLDGTKTFGFRKDPTGFLQTWMIALITGSITYGICWPWGICSIMRWEAERVS